MIISEGSKRLQKQKPVICLMGPTASGKTSLAIELCQMLGGEIISVDSALIYRDMDIGTAKPSDEERSAAVHHLIDIRDPSENYSVAEFRDDAYELLEDIYQRGKWPILAGGTMLYFKALLQGIADLPATDDTIRAQVNAKLKEEGAPALHEWLKEIDPKSAERLHPNDPQRISRAIEVYLMSGKSLTQWHQEQALQKFPYDCLQVALAPQERSILHHRIEQRFDTMLQSGFLEEVEKLMARGDLSLELPSMRSVGYRQVWLYLQGEYDLEQARYRSIVATRQLAKRQLTWLRSWEEVNWIDSLSKNNCAIILKSLSNISI
ncbi:tRNA (adenosine(37)-N6)-dimethylallyltransferase MiaA [Pleionea sediminis]|uniref:tRNA (adenosine(37)-N6)-dimethylallyltransferase MiaA n=1 Tax=Pleionea sediminis TaxID=2569479 RepID=UPI00118601CB|nr:tRNA (adenosine(37)-N6)-dimethylallyltransferase MiaA [Pleionea sediminis]